MIEAIGLKIHRILISGNHDYIKSAPQAAVNVISCPTWGIPLAKAMQEKFNTPYLKKQYPHWNRSNIKMDKGFGFVYR